jgi:ATP-binding cassette subfamily B protein
VSAASYHLKEREADILTTVHENVSAQPVVKAFGLERRSIRLFVQRNAYLLRMSIRVGFLTALLDRSAEGAIVLLQVATLGVGAAMAFNGAITVGTLAAFQALFITMSYTLLSVMEYVGDLPPAAAGLSRIEAILREEPAIADAPGALSLSRRWERIEFEHVAFGYSADQRNINNVSLSISSGSRVAFVGRSGSGKSTMLNLLMRFYDPHSGTVGIDGQNLRDVTQASLRDQIGTVLQESFLFSTTLRENIRLGRTDATDLEVEEAARDAEIHDFIASLPAGYDTQVGDRGSSLSGGQRQRVAIARALIRKPAILLMDEATSALDAETEQALNSTIARVVQGCTLIRITHRLESIVQADAIFVFDRGEVVQRGTHLELIDREGVYAQLWKKQSGFTLVDDMVAVDVQRLKELPILSELEDSLLAGIGAHLTTERFPAGRTIMHEGDAACRFYILVRGSAVVEKKEDGQPPIRLAVLRDGDFFGEIALLKNSTRTATVRAVQPCLCVSLSGQSFQTLLHLRPQIHQHITDVAQARVASQGDAW